MKSPLAPPSSRRNFLTTSATVTAAALTTPLLAQSASPNPSPAPGKQLKKFNVTIRRFNPQQGLSSGEDFVLPVDSPDEEHAVSSTMANAVSFTTKTNGSSVVPVAFTCTAISPRP